MFAFKASLGLISMGILAELALGCCIIVALAAARRRKRKEKRKRQQLAAAVSGLEVAKGKGAGEKQDAVLISAVLPWSGCGAVESQRCSLELADRRGKPAAGETCRKRRTISSHGGGGRHAWGYTAMVTLPVRTFASFELQCLYLVMFCILHLQSWKSGIPHSFNLWLSQEDLFMNLQPCILIRHYNRNFKTHSFCTVSFN